MAELVDTNSATAKASDILQGETAYVKSGMVTGTISMQAGSTVVPGTASKTVVDRGKYMVSDIVMAGDANLKPENIAKGVTLFGVKGAWEGEPPPPGLPNGFYEIIVESDNSEIGSVSGGGIASKGVFVTINANILNSDYEFLEWRKNGESVSVTRKYKFQVTEPCSFTAYFEKAPIKWVESDKLPQYYMNSIVYGEDRNIFVAVGGSTLKYPKNAIYSYDGMTWSLSSISASIALNWHDVTYGSGYFFAVGSPSGSSTNIFAYSQNGIDWTSSAWGSYGRWSCISFGNGTFVALQSEYTSDKFMYSTSSTPTTSARWASGTLPVKEAWRDIAYGGNMFVAVGDGYGMYSYDGIQWVSNPNLPSAACITYGDGKFVAIGYLDNLVYYSENGIEWEAYELPFSAASDSTWSGLAYGNGFFVATAGLSTTGDLYENVAISRDGINWKISTLPSALRLKSVTYGGGKFVAITGDDSYKAVYGIANKGV